MLEAWKRFQTGEIVVCCCMLASGILMAVYPEISALVICVILGILCLAAGINSLIQYGKLGGMGVFFRFDLSFGVCCILAGLLFLVRPRGAAALLPVALGIYMLACGLLEIQLSCEMRRLGAHGAGFLLVLGAIGAGLALFLLINPFKGVKAVMVFAGISLIVSGAEGLYTIGCIKRALREESNIEIVEGKWRPAE